MHYIILPVYVKYFFAFYYPCFDILKTIDKIVRWFYNPGIFFIDISPKAFYVSGRVSPSAKPQAFKNSNGITTSPNVLMRPYKLFFETAANPLLNHYKLGTEKIKIYDAK